MRGLLAALLATGATVAAAQDMRTLRCESEGGAGFEVQLFGPAGEAETADVPALHCVFGLALPVAAPTCAPQGGLGLSDPDGSGVRFVSRPPPGHVGGRFFAHVGPSQFVASASWGDRPPLALEVAGQTAWRMRLDLATGQATSYTRDGERALRCMDVG